MKILQIAPAWINTPPKGYGGTEWVISNLVNGLESLGHDVTLFATKKSKTNARLEYVFDNAFLDMKIPWEAALPALIHYHEAFKKAKYYDIVHAHLSSVTDIMILPFLSDLKNMGIPAVMTIHGHQPFDYFSYMDKYFLDLYAKDIWALSISKAMQKSMPKQFKNAGYLYNSLDTSKMQFSAKDGDYLTWLGKIKPDKGTANAILIAKKMDEQLIFAGVVDEYSRESVEYFETKVKPLIDGKQIIYLGPADLKLKNKLLKNAKAFINPLQWEEPFGMVMVESMACGTPVIAFNRGAAPEVILDKETGFIVKDDKQMIQAIKKIKQINRQKCREYVEAKFSVEAASKNALKIYARIINSSKFSKAREGQFGLANKLTITA